MSDQRTSDDKTTIEPLWKRAQRGQMIALDALTELSRAERWVNSSFDTWGMRVPDDDDVKKAERLIAAIRGWMKP